MLPVLVIENAAYLRHLLLIGDAKATGVTTSDNGITGKYSSFGRLGQTTDAFCHPC